MERSKGSVLRQLLATNKVVPAIGCWDCISARIIEQTGFQVVYMTGAGYSNALLGVPDVGLQTMTEQISMAHNIAHCVDIPVIGDAETGWGNAMNVIRTIREFERAGVAAVHLEDQVAPKRSGFIPGKELVSVEEFVGKIKAAKYAQEDEDFVLIARTDAKISSEGFEGMIDRLKAYAEAGADVLFPHGVGDSLDEWAKVASALEDTGKPLLANLNAGLLFAPPGQKRRPLPSIDDLEQAGWHGIALYPNFLTHIFAYIAKEFCMDLRQTRGRVDHWYDKMIWYDERNELLGLLEYRRLEEMFLPRATTEKKYGHIRETEEYLFSRFAPGEQRPRFRI